MHLGGEDPLFVARRLVRAASEDVGLADPTALPKAVSCMQACQLVGMPECDVILAQTAVYLARAPKSHEVYAAMMRANKCVSNGGHLPPVPLHLRNAVTSLDKKMGYAQGYTHELDKVKSIEYMPEELKGIDFFKKS